MTLFNLLIHIVLIHSPMLGEVGQYDISTENEFRFCILMKYLQNFIYNKFKCLMLSVYKITYMKIF